MYQLQDGGIMCLNCYSKFQAVNESQQRGLERMMNYLMDEAAWAAGIPMPNAPRFPEPKPPVYMQNPTVNSLQIQNSVVGAVNQGYVESMNASLSQISQVNESEAKVVKMFADMLIQSQEIDKQEKDAILQQLSFLTAQLSIKKEERPRAVIDAMLETITKALTAGGLLMTLWVKIKGMF